MKNDLLKKIGPVFLFCCIIILLPAQQGKILEGKVTMFSIPDTDGTVEFVVADTSLQKKAYSIVVSGFFARAPFL